MVNKATVRPTSSVKSVYIRQAGDPSLAVLKEMVGDDPTVTEWYYEGRVSTLKKVIVNHKVTYIEPTYTFPSRLAELAFMVGFKKA